MKQQNKMMKQYYSIKKNYSTEMLLFRLGDFYEMLDEDALKASSLLNLALTHRIDSPMCGFPCHSSSRHINKLITSGYRVAICEQTGYAENGIMQREVVRVITPGTVFDDEMLNSTKNNYILSCAVWKGQLTASWIDVTTGEFFISFEPDEPPLQQLKKLLFELNPSELLFPEDLYNYETEMRRLIDSSSAMLSKINYWYYDLGKSYQTCLDLLGMKSLKAFSIEEDEPGLYSVDALISYLKDTTKINLSHVRSIRHYERKSYLMMDESTQRNLELLKNLQDGSDKDSLFSVLHSTVTASGSRMLRDWIIHPLTDAKQREIRIDSIDSLFHHPGEQNTLRKLLKDIHDIPRITSRVFTGRPLPGELNALRKSLEASVRIADLLNSFIKVNLDSSTCETLLSVATLIDRSIQYKSESKNGHLIKEGFNAELDAKRELRKKNTSHLCAYIETLRDKTGITSLTYGSNKDGFYIEVPTSKASMLTSGFIEKRHTKNKNRYTSEFLIDLENHIQEATETYEEAEEKIYREIITEIQRYSNELTQCSQYIATVDCLQSLAFTAAVRGYVRPKFTNDNTLVIEKGRHPVVEKNLPPGDFIPNDLVIPQDYHRFSLITGPNMAGKSTFLRQNALIVIMAYMGSFIPAERGIIGDVDRIFCRIGASDNLARGESTFLVEMHETAYILRNATEMSIVIMDEVGRGTSTKDGISIAKAVLQYLLKLKSKTLFATHFHELTSIESQLIQQLYLEVDNNGEDDIKFLNLVKPGKMVFSYGIHVAKLAGLPREVIRNAERMLKQLEFEGNITPDVQQRLFTADDFDLQEEEDDNEKKEVGGGEETLIEKELQNLTAMIHSFDINMSTPLDALKFLEDLQGRLQHKH